MLARLLQVDAIAWAIQRDLTLLAATLRANASMHRRAEALLFSSFADGAGQEISLRLIMACEKSCRSSALGRRQSQSLDPVCSILIANTSHFAYWSHSRRIFCGDSWFLMQKSRIKSGYFAIFPQAGVLR
jgi:hypothetical protein